MKRNRPIESFTFACMAEAVQHQKEAAGAYTAEQLTARMREPLKNISTQAGEMERNAPLFHGTGSNPTLF